MSDNSSEDKSERIDWEQLPKDTYNEHYVTWDEISEIPIDKRPRWIDAHSVTCALCGQIADERETIKLWDENSSPTTEYDLSKYPNGEAHQLCFDLAQTGQKPKDGWDNFGKDDHPGIMRWYAVKLGDCE